MVTDKLDLTSLRKAIDSFDSALGVVRDHAWLESQSRPLRDTLVAGVIQNFEFVYELGVKMVRRQLERDAATAAEVDAAGYRDLIRRATEAGLIADASAWFEYRDLRNITAHAYDHDKALRVFSKAPRLLADAQELLKALASRNG
jgi:nucleotidyltransferase substrate binding protein (TIGR01987 family)